MTQEEWEKRTGGPVNPMQVNVKGVYQMMPGLTIRDYFAGLAVSGMMAYSSDTGNGDWNNNSRPEGIAKFAYEVADAMLSERVK